MSERDLVFTEMHKKIFEISRCVAGQEKSYLYIGIALHGRIFMRVSSVQ